MSYNYLENEFGLNNIIQDISKFIMKVAEQIREEKVVEEVEKITLKDISLHIVPAVENYEEIKVFAHRLGVNFYGEERGQFINVVTFHSPDIYEQEYQAFLPNDFEIVYEEEGVKIESKYVLAEEEQELIYFLNRIKYQSIFEKEFQENVVRLLNKIGYEAETDI